MFFFFAGGVNQQVRRVLKQGAGRCISCASPAVDLVEYDKVLKLFFVPVWRWPGKQPLMHCNDCNLFFPSSYSPPPPPPSQLIADSPRCRFCDRVLEPEFKFCPFCGSSL
ncbi:unnamed protein product [Linum tenue]|uniref:Zinc-ribbon 15 domain-containing protein n=1 Tax=Linum tenue TaxID=586396 RepID=A0AAV0I6G1_9ROSI|nr:unnamed protein product [Linum tenue]